jgi:hypothetical protein
VTFTITNTGTDTLEVLDAQFTAETPAAPVISATLESLKTSIAPQGTASVEVRFNPASLMELSGALEVTFDALQGGVVTVPLTGRGVGAIPRVCFKAAGQPMESCTQAGAAAPSLQVRFPALCDSRVYPPDAGLCTEAPYEQSGELYLRNEGNVPLDYIAKFVPNPYMGKDRCDAGLEPEVDFSFSNAPMLADGGAPDEYSTAPTKVPTDAMDPQPWESEKVAVTYRARSRCSDEGTDLARVIWTQQGGAGTVILVTIDGTSRLPRAVSSDWSCGSPGNGQPVPCSTTFFGANNSGDAPLRINSVALWEERFLPDGGTPDGGNGPNGGTFAPCDFADPTSACGKFAWAEVDGGDPNQHAPHALAAATSPAMPTQKAIGTLVFGPDGVDCAADGGLCPNVLYRVYAVIETDDPYNPAVITRIQGVARP